MKNTKKNALPPQNAEQLIETGVASIYGGLYKYREMREYRKEYEELAKLILMLQEDRKYLLNKYKDEINAIVHIS
jgi:hypothetical protein